MKTRLTEDMQQYMAGSFPSAPASVIAMSIEEVELAHTKNKDYDGGAGFANFLRVSKIMALYPGLNLSDPRVVALMYAMKQFDALLACLSEGRSTEVESLHDKLRDISIYMKIIHGLDGLPDDSEARDHNTPRRESAVRVE